MTFIKLRDLLPIAFSAFFLVLPCASFAQPQPPHILLTVDDFARLNQTAAHEPWAAKQRQAILDEADAFPASYEKRFGLTSMQLPPEGGQWLHYYACPDTGSVLVFHPPDQHICPDTGKVFKGYPYDQAVYQLRADFLEKAALTEALAYRLSGKRMYAEKAASILKAYADKYLSYPMHDNQGRESQSGARVYSQTLDESIWLIDLAWTYDLIRDSDLLTDQDRAHIERDLLYASAITVTRANMGITQNIQTWILGAEAAVGFTLDDKTLIDKALHGPRGLHEQMQQFVLDGFWIEGSWGYQFYAMRPITFMALMASKAGINLWQTEPNIGRLFASPLGVVFPNGMLPAFNDSSEVNLYEHAYLFEPAYAALANPALAAVARDAHRDSRFAYLFGAPSLDTASPPAPTSTVYPDAGYAALRASGSDLTVVLKFGPHGGAHGHNDKLNQIIYARGGLMSVDPGTHFYGIPIHKTWDKMTVAHNTLSVDQALQKPATGRLLQFETHPQFSAVSADAGPVYDNASLTRTTILTSDYVLEVSSAQATDGKPHDFDWNYHNFGTQKAEGSFTPWSGFPTGNGYEDLTATQTADATRGLHSTFTLTPQRTMNVWLMADGTHTQAFTGTAPGPDLRVPIPFLIARRHGQSARFIALYQPGPTAPVLDFTADGDRIHIRTAHWEDTFTLGAHIQYNRKPLP